MTRTMEAPLIKEEQTQEQRQMQKQEQQQDTARPSHSRSQHVNPLSCLPLHLVALILTHLDGVDQLPAVILSHRIFHAALHDLPTLTSDLLRAQIGDDETFVLALVTRASSPSQRAIRRISTGDLLATWQDDPGRLVAPYRHIKVPEAARIGELHGVVKELRRLFSRHALRRLYGLTEDHELSDEQAKLSPAEARRIDRAIYRFQVHVNLFGEQFRQGGDDPELKRMFFDRHSPWVNEQLACFCDFLDAQLGQVIANVYVHLPECTGWLNNTTDPGHTQGFLSLGLPWLHQLFGIKDLKAQYDFLHAARAYTRPRPNASLDVPATNFRQRQRSVYPDSGPDWNLDIVDLVHESDTESGPEQAWKDTRRGGGNDIFSIVDHDRALRRVGYVMWDKQRTDSDETCLRIIAEAQSDTTPTFAAPGRLINVARSRDRPLPRVQEPGLSARERRAARKRNTVDL